MTVFEKVKEIILNTLKVEEEKITMTALLSEDLGADSIDAVEIIMELEDTFNVAFDDDAGLKIKTVGDLVEFIENNQ